LIEILLQKMSLGHYLAHNLYRIEQLLIGKGHKSELLESAVLNQIISLSKSNSIYSFVESVLNQIPVVLPKDFIFKSVDADKLIAEYSK